jgi:hypothetical protein
VSRPQYTEGKRGVSELRWVENVGSDLKHSPFAQLGNWIELRVCILRGSPSADLAFGVETLEQLTQGRAVQFVNRSWIMNKEEIDVVDAQLDKAALKALTSLINPVKPRRVEARVVSLHELPDRWNGVQECSSGCLQPPEFAEPTARLNPELGCDGYLIATPFGELAEFSFSRAKSVHSRNVEVCDSSIEGLSEESLPLGWRYDSHQARATESDSAQ